MAAWQLASLLTVLLSAGLTDAATRRYFVQAEKEWWNFAEDSEAGLYIDKCTAKNYTAGAELYMQVGVGSRYLHARYVAYTDESFTTPSTIPTEEAHLGISGPMLRVAVGDALEVVFRNTLDFEVTFTPTGVELAENDTEPVTTNDTKTYSWNITERLSPTENGASSALWLYSSAVDLMIHQNMGLIGPMIVTRADMATADGRPKDTDLEFFVLYHVFDENQNLYFNETLEFYNLTEPLSQSNLSQPMWEEANLMHSINGKMFCWNEGLVIPPNTRVRWHVASIGGEPDIHNFHWHGMVLNVSGTFMDQFSAFAGSTFDADMVADNPGTWLFHCHVNDHIHAGMLGLYTLQGTPITEADQGDVHEHYVAANEVVWDYAPLMMDNCGATPQNLSDDALTQLTPSNFSLNIGGKYIKALFEEYTDATFTTKKAKDPSLGFLGPTLRAKVGDTIKVHFKNNARFTTGLHPHGVLYAKASEGSPYNDGVAASEKVGAAVHTGQTVTYTWYVTERSAPGPADGSSVVWMYHSHSHEIQDSYAGLMGAIIVTRRDMATNNSRPVDVDREYVMMFSITNEASSFMVRANLQQFMPGLPVLQYGSLLDSVPAFSANTNMHAINGYMYCNGPSFNASTGERVRFYIMTLGTEADLHTPSSTLQWIEQGRRSSALINIAGDMQTADIVPQAAGDFTLQCRTAEHVAGGMLANFHVTDSGRDLMSSFNGTERTAFIAATPETWDYIPSSKDMCSGEEFDEETAAQWGDGTMGKTFLKASYREFTDATFLTRTAAKNPSDGILGPMLVAEVGDVITVVFMNNVSIPVNLQLSGGFVPLHNESLIDAPVEPGQTVTYSWLVTESNGPDIQDVSTVAFTYSSNVDAVGDANAGLYGALVISRKGELKPDGLPVGVDYMIPLFYNILDESASTLFDDNLALTNFTQPDDTYDYEEYAAWLPTTQWHTINGYSWCNQGNVVLNVSSTVRWILVGMGGEVSLHTPVFEDAVLLAEGSKVYTTELAPSVSLTVDMRADFVGTWNYYCNVQEHYEGGMRGIYVIDDPSALRRATDNAM